MGGGTSRVHDSYTCGLAPATARRGPTARSYAGDVPFAPRRPPRPLLIAFVAFVALWLPVYWVHYGAKNFLWLCDLAVFMTLFGLVRGSALWLSAAAAGVLFVQVGFAVDLLGRLASGRHLVGGTEYMFDAAIPLGVRLLSLFHLALPFVHVIALRRTGYDRRGLWLMTLVIWIALVPALLFFTDDNINMVVRPFGREQTAMSPAVYVAALFVAYPLLVFWPGHAILARVLPASARRTT